MTASTHTGSAFAPTHSWEGALFVAYVTAIWMGVVAGFGPKIGNHDTPVHLIVHVHALVFVAWLAGFTAQIVYVRTDRVDLHRRLGSLLAYGIGVLIVMGPLTAWVVQREAFGTAQSDPAFFAVQLGDVIAFAGLSLAGIWFRKHAAAHKRLMLLAVLQLSTAGFARALGGFTGSIIHFGDWGSSFWQTFFVLHLTNDLMVLGMGAFDLATRGRLHPAYLWGAAWGIGWQVVHVALYLAPAWKPVAVWLLGH